MVDRRFGFDPPLLYGHHVHPMRIAKSKALGGQLFHDAAYAVRREKCIDVVVLGLLLDHLHSVCISLLYNLACKLLGEVMDWMWQVTASKRGRKRFGVSCDVVTNFSFGRLVRPQIGLCCLKLARR